MVSPQTGKWLDLNGSAPDNHPSALLLIDVINHFEFDRGEDLLRAAKPIASHISGLARRAREAGAPVIYVNDNFGRWRSNFEQLVRYCLRPDVRGAEFVRQLLPEKRDYFVLKPKHSGFYQTPLEILLKHLGTKRTILTGVSTNNCVLFTAHDAYMRDLKVIVPEDCVAAYSEEEHLDAMEVMRTTVKAETPGSGEVRFSSE
jgi:nicotinamidase-related amidase